MTGHTSGRIFSLVTNTTIPMAAAMFSVIEPLKATWVLRCTRCKAHRRLDAGTVAPKINRAPHLLCCGQQMTAKVLKGITTDHVCSAKCMGSKGHVCECSCGGKNHGKAA